MASVRQRTVAGFALPTRQASPAYHKWLLGKLAHSKLAVFSFPKPMPYLSLLLFAAVFAGAVVAWHIPLWVGALYVLASIVCLAVYAKDKAAARAGRYRTPEQTLLLLGLLCGWPGAVLAQQWLRHKSSKRQFQVVFWISVLGNVTAFVYLCSPLSFLRMG